MRLAIRLPGISLSKTEQYDTLSKILSTKGIFVGIIRVMPQRKLKMRVNGSLLSLRKITPIVSEELWNQTNDRLKQEYHPKGGKPVSKASPLAVWSC